MLNYFDENLDDPNPVRYVRWSQVEKKTRNGQTYWAVQVKYRAKHELGAYVLTEEAYLIRNGKVVDVLKL